MIEVLKYLQPNAAVPIDMETTTMLVNALRQALESQEPVACVQDLEEVRRKHLVYVNGMDWKDPLYTYPPQRTWVELTEEELRTAFGKLYPNDIGILELAENNRDYAVEAIGARHHWTAFKAGARAGEAKLKEKNI